MAERPMYETGLSGPIEPENTRPAASPVDTYVRPEESQLYQLADALKGLSPAVQSLGVTLERQKAQHDTAAGTADAQAAIIAGAKSMKDAIAKGQIDPSKSWYYQAALQEQFGRNAGSALSREWELYAAQHPDLQLNYDPANYDKAFGEFAADWTKTNVNPDSADEHFRNGFDPVVAQARKQTLDDAAHEAASKMNKQFNAGLFTEIMAQGDIADSQKWSNIAWGQQITRHVQIGYNANPKNGTALGMKAAEAIAAYAEATGNLDRLDVMKEVDLGSGSLYNTQYGQQVYQAAKEKIISSRMQQHRMLAEQREDDHVAAVQKVNKDVMAALGAVPREQAGQLDLSTLKAQAIAEEGPAGGQHVDEIQAAYLNQNTHDDPFAKQQLFLGIWSPKAGQKSTTAADITTAFVNNQLTFSSAQSLLTDLDKQDGGTATSYAKDKLLNKYLERVKDLYIVQFGDSEQTHMNMVRAQNQMENDYIDWAENGGGKGLDPASKEKAGRTFLQQQMEEEHTRLSSPASVKVSKSTPAATAPGAPGRVDWHKLPALPSSSIKKIHNELWAMQNHFASDLTPEAWAMLHAAGVSDLKQVDEFLKAQEKIQPSFIRNPWKPPVPTQVKP